MKKAIMIFLTFLLSALPFTSSLAAPLALPKCTIANWNYNGNSGGCTCYVAEKVKSATGKNIPWGGNAGLWWDNSRGKWNRNAQEPREGAIAAFSYGHVAYVDSLSLKKTATTTAKTQGYSTYYNPFLLFMPNFRFPISATATLRKITETYVVKTSQRDYTRILKNDNSVRFSSWEVTKVSYVWLPDPRYPSAYWSPSLVSKAPATTWSTPRLGGAKGLQGYIYPP